LPAAGAAENLLRPSARCFQRGPTTTRRWRATRTHNGWPGTPRGPYWFSRASPRPGFRRRLEGGAARLFVRARAPPPSAWPQATGWAGGRRCPLAPARFGNLRDFGARRPAHTIPGRQGWRLLGKGPARRSYDWPFTRNGLGNQAARRKGFRAGARCRGRARMGPAPGRAFGMKNPRPEPARCRQDHLLPPVPGALPLPRPQLAARLKKGGGPRSYAGGGAIPLCSGTIPELSPYAILWGRKTPSGSFGRAKPEPRPPDRPAGVFPGQLANQRKRASRTGGPWRLSRSRRGGRKRPGAFDESCRGRAEGLAGGQPGFVCAW